MRSAPALLPHTTPLSPDPAAFCCADGDRDRGQFIKAGAVLVFELEILEVKGDHKAKPEL